MNKRLFLVDGSSYFYRAFFGVRALSNSKGMPTNAAYGFTTMLQKVFHNHEPPYLAMVFDASGETFRNKIFGEYKAHRDPMPEDLRVQIPVIKKIPPAYNIPTLEVRGFEADDILATLAVQAVRKGFEVVIVTGDKDLMQLVSKTSGDREAPGILLYDDMKERFIGIDEVVEKFGVPPERVTDVLALMGDASDNIPGVMGIGPKGAAELIQKFGTVEAIYEKLDAVERESVRDKLKAGRKQAELSKKLVRLSFEAPVKFEPDEFKRREPDRTRLVELFRELEFTRFIRELEPTAEVKTQGISYEKYRTIDSPAALKKFAATLKKSKCFAVDTETDSLDTMRANLVGLSLCAEPGEAVYVPIGHRYIGAPAQLKLDDVRKILAPVFAGKAEKIGQNIKFDAVILHRHRLPLAHIAFDTMVAAYLVDADATSHSLAALSKQRLKHDMITYEDVTGKGKHKVTFDFVPVERATTYSCEDADVALQLAPILRKEMDAAGLSKLFDDVEMPVLSVLIEMEMNGVNVDVKKLAALSKEFEGRLAKLVKEAHAIVGREFNLESPKQLQDILFNELGLKSGRQTKTGFSTDAAVLESLAEEHPLPAKVLEYRTFAKLKGTYVDALPRLLHPETKRIHTSYNQAVAATGRLSSSDPNLQNIPIREDEGRRIRAAFVAPKGRTLVSADYSQIELRILAHLSKDKILLRVYKEGGDIHASTASEIFGVAPDKVSADMRRKAKEVNFGIVYGLRAHGLSQRLGIPYAEANDYIARTFERYEGVKAYLERIVEDARRDGFVTTILGRRRYVRDISSQNGMLRQAAERVAVNAPMQGSAADLMKLAMIRVARRLEGSASLLILQVHDELVIEAPDKDVEKAKKLLVEEMEGAYKLDVPLTVDVGAGKSWAEAKG